jgi:hypothetical protein
MDETGGYYANRKKLYTEQNYRISLTCETKLNNASHTVVWRGRKWRNEGHRTDV